MSGVIAPSPVDVSATLPIPAVGFGELARWNGHGLGLDADGYEVCTVCAADWPCRAALA